MDARTPRPVITLGEEEISDVSLEMVPDVTLFGTIVNPTYRLSADQIRDLELAAPKLGRQLLVAKVSNDIEMDAAFSALSNARVGALLVAFDPYFDTRRPRHLPVSRICRRRRSD
jgi:ABC-type uncharacterized transport system substrate-binding protein